MGQPKAALQIAMKPILTYLLERFRWKGPTMLVTAPGQQLPPGADLFDTVSADAVSGEGPLRGVLTALQHATTEIALVATVDMPGIEPKHLHHVHSLLRNRSRSDVIMLHQHGKPSEVEPFPSAYRCRRAAELILAQLESGMRAVRGLRKLPCVDVLSAPSDWRPSVWANLNSPSDVKEFVQAQEFHTNA
jgi:molybdopterin-guanine dinucleotide biosynthesis protein A